MKILVLLIVAIYCAIPIKAAITNFDRKDGFGAQFQTIIACAIYAELTGQKYVYSPFKAMEHNYDNDPDFLAKKEWLINFKDNFELNDGTARYPQVNVIHFFEHNLKVCLQSNTLKKIKRNFRENKKKSDYFDDEHFHIVVHVRRHNSHDSRIEGTDTPDYAYLAIINRLRKTYANKKPLFHIQTQGRIEEFKHFQAKDTVLHVNESTEDAFISMVLADALVTSASSMSYVAGILSEGTVFYMPFWHIAMPDWISVNIL